MSEILYPTKFVIEPIDIKLPLPKVASITFSFAEIISGISFCRLCTQLKKTRNMAKEKYFFINLKIKQIKVADSIFFRRLIFAA